MSGYKRATVNITRDEYDRLRDAEQKLRSLPEVTPEANQSIARQSEEAFRASLNGVEQRQALFEQLLSGMDGYVRDLENATAQAMLQYEANAAAEAQAYAGCLWDHFNQAINTHAEYYQNIIASNHQQYQEELAQHSRQIRRLAGSLEEKRELARQWLEAANQFCDFMKLQYAHELFTPGKVAYLERQLSQAGDNLEIGLSEAVIVTAQQLYSAFSDLHIELERLQAEWTLLVQSALETTCQILLQAEESQVVPAIDLEGNPLPYPVEVDAWSQGRLSQLITELQYIKGQLEDEAVFIDSPTLMHWLELELPAYYHALEDIILQARISALNSQLRINIADLVVQSLRDQGFALETSQYEGDDMRNAYGARLVNLEGSEVVVQVAPTGPELGENELHLQSLDKEDRTDHELQRRWYEVSQSLASYGLNVGAYVREEPGEYAASQRPAAHPQSSQQQARQNFPNQLPR